MPGKNDTILSKIFKYMKYADIFVVVILFITCLCCSGSYVMMNQLPPTLQRVVNMSGLAGILIFGIIFTLVTALFFLFFSYNWTMLGTTQHAKIIGELIYILGLPSSGSQRLEPIGEEIDQEVVNKNNDEDADSVYGFGHNEEGQWTHSGTVPKVAKNQPEPVISPAPAADAKDPVQPEKSPEPASDVSKENVNQAVEEKPESPTTSE